MARFAEAPGQQQLCPPFGDARPADLRVDHIAPSFRKGIPEDNAVPTRPPGVRANKYAGTCPNCEQRVEPDGGRLDKVDGKWVTSHIVCPPDATLIHFKAESTMKVHPGGVEISPVTTSVVPFAVPEGRYTIEFEDGSYKTLRVKRQREDANFKPGEILLSYLVGPDNDSDYTAFGHVNSQAQVVIWSKHRDNKVLREAVKVLIGDIDAARTAYAVHSGNCSRCGRTLTVPASLHTGLGPECAKKGA